MTEQGIESYERETKMSIDEDGMTWYIQTTRAIHVHKLETNPLFSKTKDIMHEGEKIGVEGILPDRTVVFRKIMTPLDIDETENCLVALQMNKDS